MFYSQRTRKGLWKRCSFSQTSDRYGILTERSNCRFLSLLPSVFTHFALLVIDLNTGNWNLYLRLPTHPSSKKHPSHTPQKKKENKQKNKKKPAPCTLTYQAGIPSAQQHGPWERARSTAPSQPHSLWLGQSPRLEGGGFQPPQAEEGSISHFLEGHPKIWIEHKRWASITSATDCFGLVFTGRVCLDSERRKKNWGVKNINRCSL